MRDVQYQAEQQSPSMSNAPTLGAQPSSPPRCTKHPVEDLVNYLQEYAQERPEVVGLWCLSLGFVLGWKLKPW